MTLDPTRTMLSPAPPSPAALGTAGDACAGCGAPLAADQRYCLNCGVRRGAARVEYDTLLAPAATAGPVERDPVLGPGAAAPRTLSPLGAAAGLGLLLLAVLVGAVIGSDREPASAGAPIVMPAATTPAAATPVTAFVSDWPGEDGWTIELQTLPKAGTTPQQVADAKAAATAAGATQVGALDASEYPSLTPDEYVVYSGVYGSKKEAKAALDAVRGAFPDARVIEVSTSTEEASTEADAGGDDAAKASDEALKALENASPEDYVKKSKKLPDTVGTEGAAPPVDQQAPGGGSDEVMTIE